MVKNVLKDGSVIEDLTGHIVKVKDATPVYSLMTKINQDPKKSVNTKER